MTQRIEAHIKCTRSVTQFNSHPPTHSVPKCCGLVTKLCASLCSPVDSSPPGSSVNGISQARILEWAVISFSRGIFPTQGSNPCLLHWQVDSWPLSHQGSPKSVRTHSHRKMPKICVCISISEPQHSLGPIFLCCRDGLHRAAGCWRASTDTPGAHPQQPPPTPRCHEPKRLQLPNVLLWANFSSDSWIPPRPLCLRTTGLHNGVCIYDLSGKTTECFLFVLVMCAYL